MSTARFNTLQDVAGANQSTTLQIRQGRAKAWYNLNGTGTIAARGSLNVSSFTDNGTGDYTATFATAMPAANYVAAPASRPSGGGNSRAMGAVKSFLADSYRFETVYSSSTGGAGTLVDDLYVTDAIFGD